jgi:16S rRNA pseudouridine516 synthase
MTLDKLLQSQGFGSRRECRQLILAGRVSVKGAECLLPNAEFAPDDLHFSVDGKAWRYRQHAYLALHKPAGYECSHQPQGYPSVFKLLPRELVARGVQCVGRLDADTTGLLLLSDDGGFIHRCSAPKKKLPKVYRVTTRHPVSEEQIAALLAGVVLHDDPAPVTALACTKLGDKLLQLTIGEGKYHQVKRMLAAAGNRVEQLHRSAIGNLQLEPALPAGSWRWLEADDLARIESGVPAGNN